MAQSLATTGVAVVPFLSGDELSRARHDVLQAVRSFPEYQSPAPDVPLVLGAFGALSNPSAFHHPTLRQLGARAFIEAIAPVLRAYEAPGLVNLELVETRLAIRHPGSKLTAESAHRDLSPLSYRAPTASQDFAPVVAELSDLIFGGWLNLDTDAEQTFSCRLGSHVGDFSTRDGSFTREKRPSPDAMDKVRIPPGHVLIFHQQLLHEIHKHTATRLSVRMFLGSRRTASRTPLIRDIVTRLETQDVIPLKSGQWPAMFSANHRSAFWSKPFRPATHLAKTTTQEWIARTLTSVRGQPPLDRRRLGGRVMASLKDLGLPLFPAYSSDEIRLRTPHACGVDV